MGDEAGDEAGGDVGGAAGDDVGTQHYFSAAPGAPAWPTEVEFRVAGRQFRLGAAGGVFSAARLDPGTAVLLRKAELPGAAIEGTLLDLGCGYGAIACVLATVAPKATVYAVDVNRRALELTRANAARLDLGARLVAVAPEDVPEERTFTEIWSNPPIRVGKRELHEMLERWLPRLAPGGSAWLVVARHLGADSLAFWLAGRGWSVRRHASQQGFRVLHVTRSEAAAAAAAAAAGGGGYSRDGETLGRENV